MKVFKMMVLLLIILPLVSCGMGASDDPPVLNSANEAGISPKASEDIVEPHDIRIPEEYYGNQIADGSAEYNQILEFYVYGKWTVTKTFLGAKGFKSMVNRYHVVH